MAEGLADLEIRRYRPGDEAGILASFNLVFREVCGPGYVDRDLAFWRWEFLDCPRGHRISLAVARDGTVAAQYAGVVYPMATAFGDCTFVHIVDSFAHPDFRKGLKRPGLFVHTAYPWFEECHEKGDAVMYGYPVPDAERVGQRFLEYHRLCVVDYLCGDVKSLTMPAPAGIDVHRVAAPGPDVNQLFARVAGEKRCLTRRDAAFLAWRYVRMPGDCYELWEARRAGALAGMLVVRPVHGLVPDACTIADWIVPEADDEAADALLAVLAERARAHGRRTLLAIFPAWSAEQRRLVRLGFAVVPSAHTLERRLTHRIYHPQLTTEWLQAHWWYTLGDSDLV